jgi:hypothetical protein
MGQSVVSDSLVRGVASVGPDRPISFVPAELVAEQIDDGRPFVAVVRRKDEFLRLLRHPPSGLQWLQVEGLLGDLDAWLQAAHGDTDVALDILLSTPAAEFSALYRLVDVCAVRNVRVSMPALPGFSKAVRLAAALRIPVRLLPGQPTREVLGELGEVLTFYLRDPMIETPVEFFHSVLAFMCGADTGSIWTILEEDPAVFLRPDLDGRSKFPGSSECPSDEKSVTTFVKSRLRRLVEENAECATCSWQGICQGYFKWPDAAYVCSGVKQLFATIQEAAQEMGMELARRNRTDSEEGTREPGYVTPSPAGGGG